MSKNKKFKTIVFVVIAIVIAVAIAVGIFFGIKVSKKNKEINTIKNAVKTEWESAKEKGQAPMLSAFDENSSFKIKSVEETDENYFTVMADVTSPDINKAVKDYNEKTKGKEISDEELNKQMVDIINASEKKTTEQKIIVIKDDDGVFHVNFTEDFVDAMFGYVYKDIVISMEEMIEEAEKNAK